MIRMDNIVKSFGAHAVLMGVSFEASDKEIFGLLGRSGAGKTTIINILTNQLKADSGSHEIDATPFETGLMLDEDGLFPRLSCIENLDVFATIYGIPRSRAFEALKNVELDGAEKRPVNKLSKGMRQRLALARAILHEPKVLFLDEPTSGLDPVTANDIHKLIFKLRDGGSTIFLTTHNMEESVRLCDYVALLHGGKIVEQGVPREICERHNAMRTIPDMEAVFIQMTGEAEA
ncbi:MAG: ABC transporter ATP-binding protein [Firmicutes bacterium]|nr:ABC transporter ATP-binding protein [Bacillota bacterium]